MGSRQRPYWCEEEGKKVEGKFCAGEKIPQHIEVCVVKPCTSWFTGNWTQVNQGHLGRGLKLSLKISSINNLTQIWRFSDHSPRHIYMTALLTILCIESKNGKPPSLLTGFNI